MANPMGSRLVLVTPQMPRSPAIVSKFPRSKMLWASAEGNNQSGGIERVGKQLRQRASDQGRSRER